jgi:putative exosortase-associated protein (TIGR04073 family)
MRIVTLSLAASAVLVFTGCAGPENKLGRGISNMTALVGGGDISRSVEQTTLWDGPNTGATGFIRGFNRAMARTGIGIYETITFPFPPYGPVVDSTTPVYPDHSIATIGNKNWGGLVLPEFSQRPDSYSWGLPDDAIFATDAIVGFNSGTVAPWIPLSTFNPLTP